MRCGFVEDVYQKEDTGVSVGSMMILIERNPFRDRRRDEKDI